MAIGKNSRMSKGGKRGKKKVVEPMSRKVWYDVCAPANFDKNRQFAKTIANKTIGGKQAADNLRGRVYEGNLADLTQSSNRDEPFRNLKFQVEEVVGRNLLTQFHSMHLTTDRVRSLLRKWCTTIESVIEATTADGFTMRLFVICFTKKQKGQQSKNCYAKTRLVKWIRHRMTNMIESRIAKQSITEVVDSLTQDTLSDAIIKRCNPILPIRDVKVTKVKVIRKPKLDMAKLMECHGEIPESNEGVIQEVEAAEEAAPAAVETA
eukprot:Tbor_TRINITY_DN4964_c0_g1::TRINITY_DN4964_c0_g1_i2::g.9836::m.9836/K02984/RP-S3Ae, RPS3A; small subunit ribosomal protein S3Ae